MSSDKSTPSPVLLFFGCQHQALDFIYKARALLPSHVVFVVSFPFPPVLALAVLTFPSWIRFPLLPSFSLLLFLSPLWPCLLFYFVFCFLPLYFQDEWESATANGTLNVFSTAFSRDQPEKVYVTHRIRENAALLWSLLKDKPAYIFVCGYDDDGDDVVTFMRYRDQLLCIFLASSNIGPHLHVSFVFCLLSLLCSVFSATKMGRDVRVALEEIVQSNLAAPPAAAASSPVPSPVSVEAGKQFLDSMMQKGRYVQELW